MIDWFGTEITISSIGNGQVKIRVLVSPTATKFWALQYGGDATVTSPQSLVDEIKEQLKITASLYHI